MIGPEISRAWRQWWRARHAYDEPGAYPLYLRAGSTGRWYMRELVPGRRVWRAEDDGSFTLIGGLGEQT